jgi:hypothetical protein
VVNFYKHGNNHVTQYASLNKTYFPPTFSSHAHSSTLLYGSVQSFNRPTCISLHLSLESNCLGKTLMTSFSHLLSTPFSSSGKPKEISFKHPCQDHHASTSPISLPRFSFHYKFSNTRYY